MISMLMAFFSPHGSFLASMIQLLYPHKWGQLPALRTPSRRRNAIPFCDLFNLDLDQLFLNVTNSTMVKCDTIMREVWAPIWAMQLFAIVKIFLFAGLAFFLDTMGTRVLPPPPPSAEMDLSLIADDAVREETERILALERSSFARSGDEEAGPGEGGSQGIELGTMTSRPLESDLGGQNVPSEDAIAMMRLRKVKS